MTTAKTKTSTKGTTKSSTRKRTTRSRIKPDQRFQQIQLAAYYIAEQRGFENGSPEADWLAAEQAIDSN